MTMFGGWSGGNGRAGGNGAHAPKAGTAALAPASASARLSGPKPLERSLFPDDWAGKRPLALGPVGVIDLGTTKICCMIGRLDSSGRPELLGVGQAPSRGLKRGMVSDIAQTVASIRRAVAEATRGAGMAPKSYHLGIAGGHLSCVNNSAMIEVANPLRGVTRSERSRALERAKLVTMPEGREIVHVIPQEYVCDGEAGVRNPVGMSCSKLEARVHIVTAAVASAQNVARCAQLAGCGVAGLLVESLASSLAILGDDEKDVGVLLLDIGGGSADVALFHDGAARFSGVVPIGGEAITRDLSRALRVSQLEAEHLKRACVGVGAEDDPDPNADSVAVTRLLSGRKARVKREFAREVVEARLEEILLAAREMVDRAGLRDKYAGGVVLTGGSAMIQGVEELAEEIFRREARVGTPGVVAGPASCPDSPVYATALGLLLHGLEEARDPLVASRQARFAGRVYEKFMRMIDWYS